MPDKLTNSKLYLFLYTMKEYQRFSGELCSHELTADYDAESYVQINTKLILLRKYGSKGEPVFIEEILDEMKKTYPNKSEEASKILNEYHEIINMQIEQILADGTKLNQYQTIEDVMYGLCLHADANRIQRLVQTDEQLRLVNINNDSIPELYINFGSTARGDIICTYYDGKVVEQTMYNYGFSYIEGQNIFRDSGGHMDVYYDKIYAIKNGRFVLLYEGNYGASDNAHIQFDSNGNPVYNYYWNGIEISSETEYVNLLNEVYNEQQAITPFDDMKNYPSLSEMQYAFGKKDKMVSIIVKTMETNRYNPQYYVYNISSENGKELSVDELVGGYNMSIDAFYDLVKGTIKKYWDAQQSGLLNSGFSKTEYDKLVQRSLEDENIKKVNPYINSEGDLCVVAYIYSPAGAGGYFHILNITNGTEEDWK